MSITLEYFGSLDNATGNLGLFELDPLIMEPIPALKYLRQKEKLDTFKCPAFTDYLKNVFYICSPLDFTIVKENNKYAVINDRDNSNLNQLLIVGLPETKSLNNQPMLGILLQYMFLNKKDNISMQIIDPPLVSNPLTNVCGEFNISKWIRPTNFCFFLHEDCESISFKRGDPLYAVKFLTDKQIDFKLILDEDKCMSILSEAQRAGSLKKWYPRLTLNQCYNLFANRMKNFWK